MVAGESDMLADGLREAGADRLAGREVFLAFGPEHELPRRQLAPVRVLVRRDVEDEHSTDRRVGRVDRDRDGGVRQVGAAQRRIGEVGAREVRTDQDGTGSRRRPVEPRLLETRTGQDRVLEVGAVQRRLLEAHAAQVGAGQDRVGQVGAGEARAVAVHVQARGHDAAEASPARDRPPACTRWSRWPAR